MGTPLSGAEKPRRKVNPTKQPFPLRISEGHRCWQVWVTFFAKRLLSDGLQEARSRELAASPGILGRSARRAIAPLQNAR